MGKAILKGRAGQDFERLFFEARILTTAEIVVTAVKVTRVGAFWPEGQ